MAYFKVLTHLSLETGLWLPTVCEEKIRGRASYCTQINLAAKSEASEP